MASLEKIKLRLRLRFKGEEMQARSQGSKALMLLEDPLLTSIPNRSDQLLVHQEVKVTQQALQLLALTSNDSQYGNATRIKI